MVQTLREGSPILVCRLPCLCHIRLLQREGTATVSNIEESSARVGKKYGRVKLFLFFLSSQKDAFLMRRDWEIQQLVNMLNMTVCSCDKGVQKI